MERGGEEGGWEGRWEGMQTPSRVREQLGALFDRLAVVEVGRGGTCRRGGRNGKGGRDGRGRRASWGGMGDGVRRVVEVARGALS